MAKEEGSELQKTLLCTYPSNQIEVEPFTYRSAGGGLFHYCGWAAVKKVGDCQDCEYSKESITRTQLQSLKIYMDQKRQLELQNPKVEEPKIARRRYRRNPGGGRNI